MKAPLLLFGFLVLSIPGASAQWRYSRQIDPVTHEKTVKFTLKVNVSRLELRCHHQETYLLYYLSKGKLKAEAVLNFR